MADTIKAKIVIEADTSGADEAAAALEKLQGMAGSFDSSGGIGDAISAMSNGFAEGTKGAEGFAEAIGAGEEAAISATQAMEGHQQVIAETGAAYEALQEPLGTAVAQLQEVAPPMALIAEHAQAINEQIGNVGNGFTQIQQTLDPQMLLQAASGYQGFAEPLAQIAEHAQTVVEPLANVNDNLAQSVIALPQFADSLHQVNENVQSASPIFGQTGESINAFAEHVQSTQDTIGGWLGSNEGPNTFAEQFNAMGSAATNAGSAVEEVGKATEGLGTVTKETGSTFGGIFGENGVFNKAGDVIDSMGESFNGFMMGFDQVMRPLMYIQMAAQMGSAAASWIYNANLAAEGPNASSPYSYTSQANLLGANMGLGGNQFAVGIGQGLLPAIEGWNAASGSGSDAWQSIGDAIGKAIGIGASGFQMMGGGLAMLLGGGGLFGNNPLFSAGQNWFTSGYEGDVNTVAQMLGQPAPFTTSSIYSGQNIQAAYQQSHYTGVSGPGDPMNAYMQAVAMNTAAGPGGYQVPYPAPNADVGADWAYFNSMPYSPAYWTNAGSIPLPQGGVGYGGTVTNQDVSAQMNQGTVQNWGGAIGSLLSGGGGFGFGGGNSTIAAGNAIGNSIDNFFGGIGQWWHDMGASVSKWLGVQPQTDVGPNMGYTGGVGAGAGVGNAAGMTRYLQDTSQGGGFDLSRIQTGIAGALSGMTLPHLDLSGIQAGLGGALSGITLPHLDLGGISSALGGAFSGITLPHIPDLGGMINGALGGMFSGITLPSIPDLGGMINGALGGMFSGISLPSIPDIGGMINGALGGMFSGISLPSIPNIGGMINGALSGMFSGISVPSIPDIGGMINGALGGMFSGIQMPNIPDVGGMINGALAGMFSGIQMPSIPNIAGMINGALSGMLSGVSIPMFASGVEGFGGGLAVVGEVGPELVALPGGSSVYPMSTNMSGGLSPVSLGGGGGGGAQTANISVYLDSQMLVSLMGASLQSSINVGMGKRSY